MVTRHVKFTEAQDLFVRRMALRRGLTINGFLVAAVARLAAIEAATITGGSNIHHPADPS